MPRNACVIQITPVRLTRTTANDASVVRKIYLSIDPIVTARSPRPARWNRSWRPSQSREPPGRAAIPPPCSLSHYHPFDPSTKWLRHGTLGIWLIIRPMCPRSTIITLTKQIATVGCWHSSNTMTDLLKNPIFHDETKARDWLEARV